MNIKRIKREVTWSWLRVCDSHLTLQGVQTGDIDVVNVPHHMDRDGSVTLQSNGHLGGLEVHVQATLWVLYRSDPQIIRTS